MDDRMFPAEMTRLINSALNETATDVERERLESNLRGNPEAIRLYLDYCELHIDLAVDAGADNALHSLCDWRPWAAEAEELSPTNLSPHRRVRSAEARFFGAALGGVLACSLAVVLGGLWWTSRSQHVATVPTDINISELKDLSSVKVVTLPAGSFTTLHLDKVGHITLHGPARFQLLSPMRARLDEGRIRMRVTEKTGQGFVIETPDGDITDLGTEFGVEVAAGKSSALAVFEGVVDLRVAEQNHDEPQVERLLEGDGVLFNKGGITSRLNSILTGHSNVFSTCDATSNIAFDAPLIVDMYDNLPAKSTKRYYEIVTRGMAEDALAYVDRRQHNWNGLSSSQGIPPFLLGADYAKTFCDDKWRTGNRFKLTVVFKRPAKLYVVFDTRLTPPSWLKQGFAKTEHRIGLDKGEWYSVERKKLVRSESVGKGPGNSIQLIFDLWEKVIDKPGPIVLGSNGKNPEDAGKAAMYGIVAVDLDAAAATHEVQAEQLPSTAASIE